ncbi:MAG: HesA/MoeB/ThiF family protein [Deltaproteobacteria bacterium]|nr:HesA/MoeB/ThiF family protein [Deltaproteobacteria bacterium]
MSARVVLVGLGGIGHPCALALAQCADISLVFLDDDRVERSNLHRLPAFAEQHIGRYKAEALCEVLAPSAKAGLSVATERLTPETAAAAIAGASVVVEGSDNFATKFLVADACALAAVPSVHGAAIAWTGTALSVRPKQSACYRCLFEDLPEGESLDCSSAGIFAPVTALVGALMAQATRDLLAHKPSLAGTITRFDARDGSFRRHVVRRRHDCALCGDMPSILSIDRARYLAPTCAMGASP